MSPRLPESTRTLLPRHDHSSGAEGGEIRDANAALLDRATNSFAGAVVVGNGLTVGGAIAFDENVDDLQWVDGGVIKLLKPPILEDDRAANVRRPFVAKTAAYTLTSVDDTVFVDATAGAVTVTLPTAVGIAGKCYTVKKIDVSVNAVTVDGDGAETVDGAAGAGLPLQWNSVTVCSDGANWGIV